MATAPSSARVHYTQNNSQSFQFSGQDLNAIDMNNGAHQSDNMMEDDNLTTAVFKREALYDKTNNNYSNIFCTKIQFLINNLI